MMQWPEIPAPRLQHRFVDSLGRFVARSDFDWEGRLPRRLRRLLNEGLARAFPERGSNRGRCR
ncbi:hypothetical protein HQ325_06675 [Rhodococcus sp. BP-349]|uniref:hypothetical protein n=1 Tax=unclassified Rhodococcus (in: high G+C Gram-positive bacteria) TaxID=192944 RepID=UPI001C9A5137|nr:MULTISPECIES: hypothetical protein [unclassified Rhodococcus (in: high G+C Gram-positive bacteria)]MBY6538351.1 hypothetical protein [Rhodococcus sp. BP-363]MBY6542688.1 hypothetical protein [Rhodococcus sp. BP-369]MBY6561918.1 hypothetical protein [Rhodococcus sp. BP-370]MBY6576210.1 hypothetical protein [Rhodococcus sp. BP-364]MBY6585511.1 hypothetical protein [Rhodococcus sp. BP-358]